MAEREPRDWKMYDWWPQWLHQFICSPATHGVPGSPYFCQLSLGQTVELLCPSGENKMASRLHFRSYFPSCWCGWGSFQRCFGLSRLLLCEMSVSFAHFLLLSCFFFFFPYWFLGTKNILGSNSLLYVWHISSDLWCAFSLPLFSLLMNRSL